MLPRLILFTVFALFSFRGAAESANAIDGVVMNGGSPQCESTPEDIAQRCTEQSEIADHVYFHAIFDFVRYSSLPLMIKQV